MRTAEAFLLWHQWRVAIWEARRYAAQIGCECIKHSCLYGTARGSAWIAKLKMQEVTADVMGDFHKSRMNHLRDFLSAHVWGKP